MSFTVHSNTLDGMWLKANEYLWNCRDHEFDYIRNGVTVHSFHNQLHSETALISRSISDFGYTKTKWAMLLRLYFDPLSYAMCIERIRRYKRSGPHKARKYIVDIPIAFNQRLNASGECLLGMTIRYSQKFGWEAEVITRASESVSRWGVDLVFIHVLIRELGEELGFKPEDVSVSWNSSNMFMSILAAPLYVCLNMPGGEELMMDESIPLETKWQRDVRKRFRRSFIPNGERRYSTFKSQERAVRAYDVLRGAREAKVILPPSALHLPDVSDIEFPEKFKIKGGFK